MAKTREPTSEEILKAMYPDIMTSDDYEQEDTQAKQTANQSNAEVAELKAQLASLQSRLDSQSRAQAALTTRQGPEVPPQMPQIDYSKAPNPIDDPEGYAKFNMAATQALLAWKEQEFEYRQQQQQTATSQVQQLWSDFSAKYKDYAKDTRKVAIAAREVTERAKASKRDVDKYMYDTSDDFMRDVAAEMDALWGKPNRLEAEVEDDDTDGRTDGLFGGGQQTALRAATSQKPQSPYGQMGQELLEWQKKAGLRK